LGLQPLRRSVARVAAPAGQDVSTWPMLLGVGEAWYAKPDAGAMLVSSAEEAPAPPGDAFADDLELARGMDFYGQSINAPLTRPMATWGGLRSFTPDRSLAIGPSDLPGLWWCAGQGGYGFQTAPAAAQLLADLISGRSPKLEADVVAALDPGRFL
ncbi:MAG: FAD-dependent oxidoreductase, partial [Pseudomonadota bacterium]